LPPTSVKAPPEITPQATSMLMLPPPDVSKISVDHTLLTTSNEALPTITPQATPMLMLPAPDGTKTSSELTRESLS
jgi:hypothetical protein